MIYDTQEALDAGVAKWQKLLRLQDVEIRACIRRQRDMDNEIAVSGEIKVTHAPLRAYIRLLDPVDYPPNEGFPQDHEQTLVHEMLHIYTKRIEHKLVKEYLPHDEEENLVETLAIAFVTLDRHAQAALETCLLAATGLVPDPNVHAKGDVIIVASNGHIEKVKTHEETPA